MGRERMGRQVYISTSVWVDDWFDDLKPMEKLVYLYLLQNDSTNCAGIYKITVAKMKHETGLEKDIIRSALEKFSADGKAYYVDEYVVIPHHARHQKFKERDKLYLGAIKIIRGLPDNIKAFIVKDGHCEFDLPNILPEYFKEGSCQKQEGSSKPLPEKLTKQQGASKPLLENSKGLPQNDENPDDPCHNIDLDLNSFSFLNRVCL
jgi:hypothetical protein